MCSVLPPFVCLGGPSLDSVVGLRATKYPQVFLAFLPRVSHDLERAVEGCPDPTACHTVPM